MSDNYNDNPHGRCWKFGTKFPIDESCLSECPKDVMRRCTDYYLNSKSGEVKAAALVFANKHHLIVRNKKRSEKT